MKRAITIILLLAALLVTFYFLFLREENFFQNSISPFKAIPGDSPVFFKIKSPGAIPLNNPVLKELTKDGILRGFYDLTAGIDSILKHNFRLSGLVNDINILIAVCPVKTRNVPIYILSVETRSRRKALEQVLSELFPDYRSAIKPVNYKRKTINFITQQRNDHSVFYTFTNNLLIASPEEILVKKAVDQIGSKGIEDDTIFSEVKKTASSQSGFSVFINHNCFPLLFSASINPADVEKTDVTGEKIIVNYLNFFNSFSKFAAWSELDFNFKDNRIELNGITKGNDSLTQFISLVKNQSPSPLQIDRIVPDDASSFFSLSLHDPGQFITERKNRLKLNSFSGRTEYELRKTEDDIYSGVERLFTETVGNELAVGTTVVTENPDDRTFFLIYKSNNINLVKEKYLQWFKNYASLKKINFSNLKSDFSSYNRHQFTVYHFPYPSVPGLLFGWPFALCNARFLSFIDNYVVFSNNLQGLKDCLNKAENHFVINNDLVYNKLKPDLNSDGSFTMYVVPGLILQFCDDLLNPDSKSALSKYERTLRNASGISWQIVSSNGFFFNHFSFLFNEKIISDSEKRIAELVPVQNQAEMANWHCKLKNRISSGPQLVINHNDKINKEIVLQDDGNVFYLISNDGNIRWNIQIGEKILGKVHQIDFFRNGKFQYLFNTPRKLYLIDRNGNNVAGFPKSFDSPATNEVAVFDYDQKKDYRYLLAFKNRRIEVFNRSGTKQKGWNFGKTGTEVSTPARHFLIDGKDYIVFKDLNSIYFLDRKGNAVIDPVILAGISNNPLAADLKDTPKLIVTDKNGLVHYIYFNGRVKTINTGLFGNKHLFNCADLNGDGNNEFIFADENYLKVSDEKGRYFFTRKFGGKITQSPVIYEFPENQKFIGIVDSIENAIYLFDTEGNLHSGFSKGGSTGFTIGKISINQTSQNLIVGSADGILYMFSN